MRGVLREFLTGVIKNAVVFAEHSRRKTVSTHDVVMALKRNGNSSWHTILYGYDDDSRRPRRRRPVGLRKPTSTVANVDTVSENGDGMDLELENADADSNEKNAMVTEIATEEEKEEHDG